MAEQRIQESKSDLGHQVGKLQSIGKHYKLSNITNATIKYVETIPIYEQISINPIPEASKMPDLQTYISMILKSGKESYAGATYQTQDFSAVCIDEKGGVVSLDYYDVTLLLPPLSLHESCLTIFLYMERMVVKRVHGNPTYASPVVRIGSISSSGQTPFKENVVLSVPLFTDNQYIVPFYRQDVTEMWTELSVEDHAFIKNRSRCTMSIDKTGLYVCLNYMDDNNSDTRRTVLSLQCSTFVGSHATDDVRIEFAFWLSSETQLERCIQKQHCRDLNLVDGSRELLLNISDMVPNKTLIADVTGICEGWTIYGGKQKYIQLSTINEELRRSDGVYTVEFKFNRNQSCDTGLACKLRIYAKEHEGGYKEKLSLFRYNCMRKRSTSDETDGLLENRRIVYRRNSNNSRDILDVIDRCLAHITKIISSNLNGVWEKRFAKSLNIPAKMIISAKEIFLINKALYVFIGNRVVSMNDNDIVLDFITAANSVARELENEAMEKRHSRAVKTLSLPQGARLMVKPKYNRSTSCFVDNCPSMPMSRCLVTPPTRPPRRESLPYYLRNPEQSKGTRNCCDELVVSSSESLTLHNGNVVDASSTSGTLSDVNLLSEELS